jgi:hypothetical protein
MAFMEASDGMKDPCPSCGCWSLRRYIADDGTAKTACVMSRCDDFHFNPADDFHFNPAIRPTT